MPGLAAKSSTRVPLEFLTAATQSPFSTASPTALRHSAKAQTPSGTSTRRSPEPTSKGGNLPNVTMVWSGKASSTLMPFLSSSCRSRTTPALHAGTLCTAPGLSPTSPAIRRSVTASPSSTTSPTPTRHASNCMPGGTLTAACPGPNSSGESLPTTARARSGRRSSRLKPLRRRSCRSNTIPLLAAGTVCLTRSLHATSATGSPLPMVSPTLTRYFLKMQPAGAADFSCPGPTCSACNIPSVATFLSLVCSTRSPGFSSCCNAITTPSLVAATILTFPFLSFTLATRSPFATRSPSLTRYLSNKVPAGAIVGLSFRLLLSGFSTGLSITTMALSSSFMSGLSPRWSLCKLETVPATGAR
mmetsp:Transcript_48199/g.153840  ORF Transcript_48199/g.153840 Transcript_48199/m.153840 type:complete len:359 (-) Transcript_48199:805-1881(-)